MRLVAPCLVFGLASAFLGSCAQDDAKATTKKAKTKTCAKLELVNGVADTTRDAVALLLLLDKNSKRVVGRCTGTWIGSNAVLTASHCIDQRDKSLIMVLNVASAHVSDLPTEAAAKAKGAARPTDVYVLPEALSALGYSPGNHEGISPADGAMDFAILKVDGLTPKATMAVRVSPLPPGAEVKLYGYGTPTWRDSVDPNEFDWIRRTGTNKVSAKQNPYPDTYVVIDPKGDAGKPAYTSVGDSGGPLVYKDTVAGTVSSGATSTTSRDVNLYYESDAVSIYSSLQGEKAKALFALAKTGGAKVDFAAPDEPAEEETPETTEPAGASSGSASAPATTVPPTTVPATATGSASGSGSPAKPGSGSSSGSSSSSGHADESCTAS